MPWWTEGSKLALHVQQECKRRYVHRYTGEHKPAWVTADRGAHAYQPQFADDADWLAHTRFAVTKTGELDNRVNYCDSSPTWPNGKPARARFDETATVNWPVKG